MMIVLKNLGLLLAAIVLSYFSGGYAGAIYSSFVGSGGVWIGSEGSWNFIIGFPFAFIFFIILIIKLFGAGNRNKWIAWLLVPPGLLFVAGDIRHIYVPIILGLIALIISRVINMAVVKLKRQGS